MKTLLTITILLAFNTVLSQTVLDFTVVDNCTEKKVGEYDITIASLDFDKEMKDYWIEKDSVLRIEKGIYSISVNAVDGDNFKSYNFVREFNADSTYSMDIQLPKIMRKYTRELHYPTDLGFYNCDEVCDGLQQDFYANGKLRIEGEFKNGIPVKEIKKYNESGDLVEIELYRRNGTYRKSKYPDYELYLKNN
tara:strand:+ start:829 stop:1407 length:579 start_codon:yes stop_codon:yes gene_type:complete